MILNNKTPNVSILGDSISTFKGWCPPRFTVYYDEERQRRNGITGVEDMWWYRTIQALHGKLCQNDSFSGSKITGRFPAATSEERLFYLRNEDTVPDIILLMIGYNDSHGVQVRRNQAPPRTFPRRYPDLFVFEDAYAYLISSLQEWYPQAVIIQSTLMQPRLRGRDDWVRQVSFAGTTVEDYNEVIREQELGPRLFLADLAKTGRYETLDEAHPTRRGHYEISTAWIQCLKEMGFIE